MAPPKDSVFRAKVEVLLGERKGATQDRAVRLREIESLLRNSTALSGVDPAIIKPIVDKAVDDALVDWTPPDWDPILERIDQAEQDAEQAKQAALNAVAQANAANEYTDQQVALVNADIAGLTALTGQIAGDLQDGLDAANAYTDSGFASYDTAIQGQFASFAGQIEQLTAALTSTNLVQNGLFALAATGWTLTEATVRARADLTGLGAAAPQPNLVELAAAPAASISAELNTFAVTANDRVQFRFFAAAAASRTITVTLAWEDAAGDPVGTPATETLTIAPANTWKVYGKQVDPPDTATGATLTIAKAAGGAGAYLTAIEVGTVNIALEARVTQLEAAQITEDDVIATISTQVNSRFEDAEAAISDEASARASADAALTTRQTRMSVQLDREAGGVLSDPYLASSGWLRWQNQGVLALKDNEEFETGRTWDFTVTAAQTTGMQIVASPDSIWPGQTNASAYVVEVDYTLMSGTLGGAFVLLDWNAGSAEFRAQKSLADMTPGSVEIGRVQTARGVFRKPASFTGTFTSHDLYVLANFSTGLTAKRIKFHRVKVRVATAEEMGSGEVMAAVKAELATNHYTKAGTNEAIAGFDIEAGASLGTAWATVQQSAAALADLNGSVARFRNVATVNGELVAAGIEATAWNIDGATGSLLKLIGDNVVAEGTMSMNRLVVGLGKNLFTDPDFMDGLSHWDSPQKNNPSFNLIVRAPGLSGSHPGFPTIGLQQTQASTIDGYIRYLPSADGAGQRIPGAAVEPGKHYFLSAYLRVAGVAAGEARLYVYWRRADGTIISENSAPWEEAQGSLTVPDSWRRHARLFQAPSGAVYMDCLFQMKRATGATLFLWKPQLEESHAKASQPTPWSPGGTTFINGGRMFAKSILARSVDTEDFAAAGLAIFGGTVQSDNFNLANGTGWRITNAGQMNMPAASVGNAQIYGAIQSDNFISGAGGRGWRINKSGAAEFNTIKIRRQIEVASGTLNLGTFNTPDANITSSPALGAVRYVMATPIAMEAWQGADKTYIATAGMTGTVSSGNTSNCYWGWDARVLPLTKWSGDQSLRLRLEFWASNVSQVQNCIVTWKIYEVS